ncbi:MAG TPA: hypothetical protein VE397_13725 [Stellaceae bacterium]|jgi:hypothetical protein|nr:hypothetical protein [Stellaceae bacterium]
MDDITPGATPPHVPPVEPELLGSAIFLFSEYLQRIADLDVEVDEEDEDAPADEEEESPIQMREVLDLFAEELGTSVPVTLNLYMRVTALYRLLAGSPSLARMAAADEDGSGGLSEDALLAFARLDVHVSRTETGVVADFDARDLRDALTSR